jgi:hypothetical protein
MSLWTEPSYPGDTVREVMLHRRDIHGGDLVEEIGTICIQHYGKSVRVGSFLPGVSACSPGDTLKTEPEKSEWCTSSFAADDLFDKYLGEAYEDFWQNYYPEQHNG